MPRIWVHRTDQELPARALAWYQRDENDDPDLIDFSTGWTFTVDLVAPDGSLAKTFADSIVAKAAVVPNVVLNWPVDAFTTLPATDYEVHVIARNNSSQLDDMFDPEDPPILRLETRPVASP